MLRRPLTDHVEPVVAHAVLLVEQRAGGAEEGGRTVRGAARAPQAPRGAEVEQLKAYRDDAGSEGNS